jgi:peptidoglycan/LPS O-acetylase OafA/YrhL
MQILRAVAATMVVFYHFALEGSRYSHGRSCIVSSGLGRLGEAGVDLFFVLSGFIMFYTAGSLEGFAAALGFLKKRALRIYPVYWFWTTVLLILWKEHLALTSHVYSNAFLVKSYLLIPAFSGENLHPFLNQGWTLTYELLFYLLFAVAVAVGLRRRRVGGVLALVASGYGAGFAFAGGSVARQVLTNPLVFEFVFGVVVGDVCLKLQAEIVEEKRHRLAKIFLCLGVVLFVASIGVRGEEPARLLLYGVPSFCVVLGAALWRERAYHPYLVFLGDASYSIYLMHGMGVMVFATLLRRGGMLQRVPLDLLIFGGTLLLVPLCAVGYLVVERPLLSGGRWVGLRRRTVSESKEGVSVAVS